jgi:hypothetical protein
MVRARDRVIHAVATGYRGSADAPRCVTPRMLGNSKVYRSGSCQSVVLRKAAALGEQKLGHPASSAPELLARSALIMKRGVQMAHHSIEAAPTNDKQCWQIDNQR